jgi:hypothetical protein
MLATFSGTVGGQLRQVLLYMDLNGQFHGQAAFPPGIGPSAPRYNAVVGYRVGLHTLEKIDSPVSA